MRRFLRRPSHATVVAYLALFIAMSGTAVAATGGSVILGHRNSANSTTTLHSQFATPLKLSACCLNPPLAVNSSSKVTRLNVDMLDGRDSSYFQPRLTGSLVVAISFCPAGTLFQQDITLQHTNGGQFLYKLCRVT
jgi:hypothetical protein